jgi:hypothetical protein
MMFIYILNHYSECIFTAYLLRISTTLFKGSTRVGEGYQKGRKGVLKALSCVVMRCDCQDGSYFEKLYASQLRFYCILHDF